MDRELFGYLALCRLRRLAGDERFAKWGRWVPQCRLRVPEEPDPWATAGRAAAALARRGRDVAGARLLVVGCGPSNGLGYALAAMGAAFVVCQDATAAFDVGRDAKDLAGLATRFPGVKFSIVKRAAQLEKLADAAYDASLSATSPTDDPTPRVAALRRLLAPGGLVVHQADFRAPLLRYPYHRLLFARQPGKWSPLRAQASPWRCDDHIAALTGAGFDVDVAAYETDAEAFAAVADRLHPDYADRDPALLAVTRVTLVGCLRRPGEALPPRDPSTGGDNPPRTPLKGEGEGT
ncbi:MAG: class I SAM-dependent methyltransferase [Solidesulfovibrio sp. DCME]|uniref:class I SAM-dependent methyltransferase n=1 Tax=Solidesulfovibrio sp. DCME TaxID=3447380 RepID=UPI003D0A3CCF